MSQLNKAARPPTIPNDANFLAVSSEIINTDKLIGNTNTWKKSVRVGSVFNLTLQGLPQTIDGVVLNNNDRILVKDQTNPVENGIYLAKSGSWARTGDMQLGSTSSGATIFVVEGTMNKEMYFNCTNATGSDIVGMDGLTFIVNTIVGSAAGLNTQVQFNDGGVFGASALFGFDQTTSTISLGSTTTKGIIRTLDGNPTEGGGDLEIITGNAGDEDVSGGGDLEIILGGGGDNTTGNGSNAGGFHFETGSGGGGAVNGGRGSDFEIEISRGGNGTTGNGGRAGDFEISIGRGGNGAEGGDGCDFAIEIGGGGTGTTGNGGSGASLELIIDGGGSSTTGGNGGNCGNFAIDIDGGGNGAEGGDGCDFEIEISRGGTGTTGDGGDGGDFAIETSGGGTGTIDGGDAGDYIIDMNRGGNGTTGNGGDSGDHIIDMGDGGTGAINGGDAGNHIIDMGNGGNGTTGIGGNGGNIMLYAGVGGTGGTTPGTDGNIVFRTSGVDTGIVQGGFKTTKGSVTFADFTAAGTGSSLTGVQAQGKITITNATLTGNGSSIVKITNTSVLAEDMIMCNVQSWSGTGKPVVEVSSVTVGVGYDLIVYNVDAVAMGATPLIIGLILL